MSASGLDLILVLLGEHVRVGHPRLLARTRAYMWCKTSGEKIMQTDRSGGDGGEPEGRVLQRNRKHSANHWGSLGLAAF